MSTYELLLAAHILCAVVWVGGGVTLHLMGRIARASGDGQRMLLFSEDALKIGGRLYPPLAFLLLIFGILLVNEAGYDHSDLWISLAYLGWLASLAIGVGFYPRAGKLQEEIVEREGVDSQAFLAQYDKVALVNRVEVIILLLVVVDMAIKPGS